MTVAAKTPSLKILHVLTLNGRNGEYGGPVSVAREICAELNARGHQTQIFSGALLGSEPIAQDGLNESYLIVEPISQKLKISSLWNWKIVGELSEKIKKADIVHIHFARDLIPLAAALLCVLLRRPFVTQTHGMVVSDGRKSTRLTDLFLTKPLINRSKMNLVLSKKELSTIHTLSAYAQSFVLPNGIKVPESQSNNKRKGNRIVFCARLDPVKRVHYFIKLAEYYRNTNLKFEIYGPDGGELAEVNKEIEIKKLSGFVQYKGPLQSHLVRHMLEEVDLLVLPSREEAFPMVILEALSIGTPVLVMPSCGISTELRLFNSHFVAQSGDFQGLLMQFELIKEFEFFPNLQIEIANFCRDRFGIENVVASLETEYMRALKYA